MAGPLAQLLARSEALRVVYTLLIFIPISFCALLASFTGRMALMVPLWHVFAWWMGVTVRVHGKAPPVDAPSVWVANHFNWFDWPMLQVAAPYKLFAVVKARRARGGCSAPRAACEPRSREPNKRAAGTAGGVARAALTRAPRAHRAGGHRDGEPGGAHAGSVVLQPGRNLLFARRPQERRGAPPPALRAARA